MAKFFINRPIVAMVISIVLVLVGLIVMRGLPIAQYPDIVPPMINVTTTYYGASALDIEETVATPLEQQINGVENMIYMKSINSNDGTMTLQISFEVGSDLDMSNVLTQNRVSQANAKLPLNVKTFGVTVKKSLAFPLMILTVNSPDNAYDMDFLNNYVTINMLDPISRIKGVGEARLFAGNYGMRVWVRPEQMGKLGLTVPEVLKAIQDQNVISPAGQFGAPPSPQGTEFTYTVRTQGRLLNEEEFGQIVVRTNPNGSQVRLKDIARIELGSDMYTYFARNNGKPAAALLVYQTPGSNAIEVVTSVKKAVAELEASFPPGLKSEITLDTTLPIEEGISEIVTTLFEAVILVIIVVFIFLQNWRATLIPLLTVPVSLIATFIVFPMIGFSINTLSLLGMVLAIGIVVDDAIVVVEAVIHHIERGLPPKEATLKAMEEVSGPVVAIALILAAVFVPVAFMGGITGQLYQQFAITIAISVLFSAFNALTLSPALAAKLLKPKGLKKSPLEKFYNWFNKYFDKFTGGYLSLTSILIRKTFRSLAFVGVTILFILVLFRGIPSGFVPEEDNGYFMINIMLPDASSLQRTDAVCSKVEKILAESKVVANYTTVNGYSFITGTAGPNVAGFFITMKPWEERSEKSERSFETVAELNKVLAKEIPGAIVYVFGPPAIQGLGTGSGFSMLLQDKSGHTAQELSQQLEKFLAEARKRPEIGGINSFYRSNSPQVFAEVDRDKTLKQGVSISDVNTTLGSLLGSNYINDFNRFGRIYKVFLSAEAEFRDDAWDLGSFFVKNNNGDMVPLNTLITMRPSAGPEFTNRFNLYRSAEITGIPAPGYSSQDAMTALEEVAQVVLPQGWGYDWTNMSYQEKKAAGSGSIVFVFALLFVFLILAAQYESWSLPMSVLLGVPFAVFGALLGLWIAGFFSESYVNNIFAQIGFVTLIGLSAKNAILIVEFAKMRKEQGLTAQDAALDAAKLRLRPILMTSFAFILGVLPLVRAAGAGAEARKVMGMAVFSGLLVATTLAIFFVPSLYVMVEKYLVRGKIEQKTIPPSNSGNEEGH